MHDSVFEDSDKRFVRPPLPISKPYGVKNLPTRAAFTHNVQQLFYSTGASSAVGSGPAARLNSKDANKMPLTRY
jgi:hypothetical protein